MNTFRRHPMQDLPRRATERCHRWLATVLLLLLLLGLGVVSCRTRLDSAVDGSYAGWADSSPVLDLENPQCFDDLLDGEETGVDCGGPVCLKCPGTRPCMSDRDCASNICRLGICVAAIRFDAATRGARGGQPGDALASLAAADFNGDSIADLFRTGRNQLGVGIFLVNSGGGSLGVGMEYLLPAWPLFAKAGDFDGDGRADLAVSTESKILIALGDGRAHLSTQLTTSVVGMPMHFDLADFDGDGHLDMVVPDAGAGIISLLYGRGDGTLAGAVDRVKVASGPIASVAGDLDGDGHPDVITASFGTVTTSLFRGRGQGMQSSTFPIERDAGYLPALADLDGDKDLDLALPCRINEPKTFVCLFQNDGHGRLSAMANIPVDESGMPPQVRIADINSDEVSDMVLMPLDATHFRILPGLGGGAFGQPVLIPLPQSTPTSVPLFFLLADFDGNRSPDIAVTDRSGLVYLMFNASK